MNLYNKHRPETFEDMIGNSETIHSLQTMISKKEHPHAYLFHGEYGCGKTTLGRILASSLGCKNNDFREIDSADFRGIDSIREIRKQSIYKPLESSCRVWLLDECFAEGTQILLASGETKPIEQIIEGDCVYNLNGKNLVKNVFKNKVQLDRVIKVHFQDGRKIICSKEHKFMASNGWKKAYELNTNDLTFLKINTKFMHRFNLLKRSKNYAEKKMQKMWEIITEAKEVLQQSLQSNRQCKTSEIRNTYLSNLQNGVCSEMVFSQYNLFSKMRERNWRLEKNRENCKRTDKRKDFKSAQISSTKESRTSKKIISITFGENDRKQPYDEKSDEKKSNNYQKNKGNIACLERRTWWKWQINRISNYFGSCFKMAYRSFYCNRSLFWRKWIPYKLQSRYREQEIEISNRSRWEGTSFEKSTITRQEKRNEIKAIRVERIEVYQRRYNEQSFNSIIGDKEKNQNFVTFYDLEIEGHPSYYANNILVHNCHKLSNDAMNALLKALEDTPKHVYYILCTTDPQKLISTVRSRCQQFKVELLTEKQILILLKRIIKKEGGEVNKKVLDQIIQDSLGHPRDAIQVLEKVLSVPEEKQLKIAKKAAETQNQVIELCRALLKMENWNKISSILKGIKNEDPEKIRLAVFGYCSSVLLNGKNNNAAIIMEEFQEPFFNNGFNGVVFACYSIICGA